MANDFFLDVKEIPGESTDSTYKDKIDILSWSFGESQSGSSGVGGGAGVGKVSMQDLHITMHTNKASAKLFLACANGKHIATVKLIARKAAGDKQVEYLTITLTDAMVSSFQTGGSRGANDMPLDQVSFNFAKIEYAYIPQKADGGAGSPEKAGWDLKTNTKV